MREVSLFDAKAKLSALVADAEAGETIAITRRGVVVAHLTPPAPRPADDLPRTLGLLLEFAEADAAAWPAEDEPFSWEDLKAEMEEAGDRP
jgi:prevent-host-death family protein